MVAAGFRKGCGSTLQFVIDYSLNTYAYEVNVTQLLLFIFRLYHAWVEHQIDIEYILIKTESFYCLRKI